MQTPRFRKNDQGFICERCGAAVEPLGSSSRNHCPFCLYSMHVDIMPGDRENPCGGLMEPVSAVYSSGKYVIIHRCMRCGQTRRNRAVPDARVQPDDVEKLIELTSKPWKD